MIIGEKKESEGEKEERRKMRGGVKVEREEKDDGRTRRERRKWRKRRVKIEER
jgi:hypothetical protein